MISSNPQAHSPELEVSSRKRETRVQPIHRQALNAVHRRTDRLFAGLLVFQGLAGIVIAVWISPRT